MPLRSWCKSRIVAHNLHQLLAMCELAVAEGFFRTRVGDSAIMRHQRTSIGLPALGCHVEERLPGRDRYLAELRSHLRSRPAPECAQIKRGEIRVPHDHGDGVRLSTQLFSHLLGQRGADVLAHLYLAGKDCNLSISADVQPGSNVMWDLFTTPAATGFLRNHARPAYTHHQPCA